MQKEIFKLSLILLSFYWNILLFAKGMEIRWCWRLCFLWNVQEVDKIIFVLGFIFSRETTAANLNKWSRATESRLAKFKAAIVTPQPAAAVSSPSLPRLLCLPAQQEWMGSAELCKWCRRPWKSVAENQTWKSSAKIEIFNFGGHDKPLYLWNFISNVRW